jgi:hypothetical protein
MTDHPELGAAYNNWMAKQIRTPERSSVGDYDFSAHRKVVDVGGGQGATFGKLDINVAVNGVCYAIFTECSRKTALTLTTA